MGDIGVTPFMTDREVELGKKKAAGSFDPAAPGFIALGFPGSNRWISLNTRRPQKPRHQRGGRLDIRFGVGIRIASLGGVRANAADEWGARDAPNV